MNLQQKNFLRTDDRLDFNKLDKLPFAITIIITERGWKGKSFGAKEYILDKWVNDGKKSGWVLNTDTQWDHAYHSFINENRKIYPERWKYVEVVKNGLYYGFGDSKERFCKFMSVSGESKERNAREYLNYLIFDEFNEGIQTVRQRYVSKFDSLVNTHQMVSWDEKTNTKTSVYPKIFMFGNNKTIMHPIFEKLGIMSTNKIFTHGDKKSDEYTQWLLFVPSGKMNKKKRIIDLGGYEGVSEKLGTSAYSIFNKNIYENPDNTMSIKEFNFEKHKYTLMKQIIKLKETYHLMWYNKIDNKIFIHEISLDEIDKRMPIITTKKRTLDAKVVYSKNLKLNLEEWLQLGILWFESYTLKMRFIGEM